MSRRRPLAREILTETLGVVEHLAREAEACGDSRAMDALRFAGEMIEERFGSLLPTAEPEPPPINPARWGGTSRGRGKARGL